MNIVKKSVGLCIIILCPMVLAELAPSTAETIQAAPASIDDGPYVFIKGDNLEALWLCQGKVKRESVPVSALPKSISHCNMPADLRTLTTVPPRLEYQGDFQIAALSDIHGQFDLMVTLLTNNGIIDRQGDWVFGDGHFVIGGDVFNRGDKVTEILWFLYRLEQQAMQAGGKLHLLLGNHEVMAINGDLRYLHNKYLQTSALLKQPFPTLFAKDTVLGAWLRSKPILLKINSLLFVHGGIAPDLIELTQPLALIDSVFKAHLEAAELDQPREGLAKYLHGSNGPTWYRGYFKIDGASTEEVGKLLQHFQVNHIVVGHTSQKKIETRHRGKIIAIDSGIKTGKYGELLFVDANHMWRGTPTGEKLKLE